MAAPSARGESDRDDTPAGLAPAEIATLLRGTVDTGDIAASVIDLAIRGRLRIRELPRTARPEWELTTVPPPYAPGRDARPFEGVLMSGLFGRTDRIRLSELVARSTLDRVQRSLDYQADQSGWFRGEPKHGRMIARAIGAIVVLVGVAVALVVMTTSSVPVGSGIVAAAVGLAAIAWGWPRPSADGALLRGRIAAYRRFLGRATFGDEHLAYAIVLGRAAGWNGADTASWYASATPDPALKRLRKALGGGFARGSADRVSNGEGIDRSAGYHNNI